MLDPTLIRFRPLEATDFPLMQRWLNTPHVLRWWKEPLTLEQVAAKYLPRIERREPTRQYLILYGGTPIGSIQAYLLDDYREYEQAAQVEVGAAGVDLFIGEAEYLYQGLGPEILRRFLRQHVFSDPDVGCCVLGPDPENRAAIRCYEKAGFRYLKTIQVPGEDVPEYLMRILRELLEAPDGGGRP